MMRRKKKVKKKLKREMEEMWIVKSHLKYLAITMANMISSKIKKKVPKSK
jgi:hypothetical protein